MSVIISYENNRFIIEFLTHTKSFGAIISRDIMKYILTMFHYEFKNIDDIEYMMDIILCDTTYISHSYNYITGKIRLSIIDIKCNHLVIYMHEMQHLRIHDGVIIKNNSIVHNDTLKRKKITDTSYTYYIM